MIEALVNVHTAIYFKEIVLKVPQAMNRSAI